MTTTMREVIPSGNEYIAIATVEAFQGTAEAVSWPNVTGKPVVFPPETHNHASDSWLVNLVNPIYTHINDSNLHVTAAILLKIAGIADNANNYIHPVNHPASIITEDGTHRFVTDALIAFWNNKAEQSDIDTAIAALVGSAPETLNAIDEIATALQNNPDVITELLTSVGLRVTQFDFDSHANDGSKHVTQAILNKISSVETGATADQTGIEIRDLLDALFGNANWRTSGESMLLADPTTFVKATTDSFATVLTNAITNLNTRNYGSRKIVILLSNGVHNLGDDVFELIGQYNGRVVIEAVTAIPNAGSNQNAEIVLTGSGYFKMLNGFLNIDFSMIKITVLATHHLIPFNIDGNINFTTYRCCWNMINADAEATCIFMAGCRVTSYDDTFIGSDSQITNFVKFARGGDDAQGGIVQIFNAHFETNLFTNAVNGKGLVAFGNSEGVFTNKIANGAIDISANNGGSGVNVPVMTSGIVNNIAQTTADFVTEFNRAGTIYFAILPTASAAPSIEDIIAGTGATDYGNIDTNGLTIETANVIGLTAATAYKAYYFGRDELGNDTPVYMVSEFSTTNPFYEAIADGIADFIELNHAPGPDYTFKLIGSIPGRAVAFEGMGVRSNYRLGWYVYGNGNSEWSVSYGNTVFTPGIAYDGNIHTFELRADKKFYLDDVMFADASAVSWSGVIDVAMQLFRHLFSGTPYYTPATLRSYEYADATQGISGHITPQADGTLYDDINDVTYYNRGNGDNSTPLNVQTY